jgi:SAM-dependent methyltransferase
MSEAYGAFAYAYDRALGRRFFKAARRLLDDVLARYPASVRTHLDVACGTGSVVDYFRRKGWHSAGVDASVEMLRLARGGVAGDMRQLPFRGTFARVTCLYDSLNHLLDRNDLLAAFRSIRDLMDDDSLFVFDMNHPEIYPEVWGIVEPYVSSGRDYHLELATSFRKRDRLGRAMVTGWARINGHRVEISEQHLQRAYSQKEITQALSEAGLESVEVREFDPYGEADEIDAATVKLVFIARTTR